MACRDRERWLRSFRRFVFPMRFTTGLMILICSLRDSSRKPPMKWVTSVDCYTVLIPTASCIHQEALMNLIENARISVLPAPIHLIPAQTDRVISGKPVRNPSLALVAPAKKSFCGVSGHMVRRFFFKSATSEHANIPGSSLIAEKSSVILGLTYGCPGPLTTSM